MLHGFTQLLFLLLLLLLLCVVVVYMEIYSNLIFCTLLLKLPISSSHTYLFTKLTFFCHTRMSFEWKIMKETPAAAESSATISPLKKTSISTILNNLSQKKIEFIRWQEKITNFSNPSFQFAASHKFSIHFVTYAPIDMFFLFHFLCMQCECSTKAY